MGLKGTKGYCQRRLENNKIKYLLEKQNQKKKEKLKVGEMKSDGEVCKNMGTILRKLGKKKGIHNHVDLMTEIGKGQATQKLSSDLWEHAVWQEI